MNLRQVVAISTRRNQEQWNREQADLPRDENARRQRLRETG
jgi:hypothetical protein